MSKKSITQMNSIVVDGINQTTNDDLLVVARPSNVEIGTNFKLTPQSFIKFLRNNTISRNSFFPINLTPKVINVQEGQTIGTCSETPICIPYSVYHSQKKQFRHIIAQFQRPRLCTVPTITIGQANSIPAPIAPPCRDLYNW